MENKIKILLDTDLGSDCDDSGALAVLHNLADQDKAEILGITHCASERTGLVSVMSINSYYGRPDIPVGQYKVKPFLEEPNCTRYTSVLAREYENVFRKIEKTDIEDSVKTMRKVLANNIGVVMVSIGILNNIALLLKSQPDEISDLNGIDLVKKSVSSLYVMGGNFEDLSFEEYNIKCSIDDAQYVSENFPARIVYCGFEIGSKIKTGEKLKSSAVENPVRKAYQIYSEDGLRESWDPITVYCAINQKSELFTTMEDVAIRFDMFGRTVICKGGKDAFLIMNKPLEEIRETIDNLLV